MKNIKMINLYNNLDTYKHQLLNLFAHLNLMIIYIQFPNIIIPTLIFGWIFHNIFHSLFLHRIYTHRQFTLNNTLQKIGQFGFSMLNLGSPHVYAAVHLKHHKFSSTKDDPHDPYHTTIWRSILSLWTSSYNPPKSILKNYLYKKENIWYYKNHFKLSCLCAICFPFTTVMAFWLSKIVIIIVHLNNIGYRNFDTKENSKNIWWLKPIMWGDEMHNNHHYKPANGNLNFANSWKEYDLMFYIGKFLETGKIWKNS